MHKNNPNAEYIAVNAPLDAKGKFNYLTPIPTGDIIVMNKKFKHPEALIKIINVTYDAYRGFDKESYSKLQPVLDKGVAWRALFPTGGFILDYYDIVPKLGKAVKTYVDTGVMSDDKNWTSFDKSVMQGAKDFAEKKTNVPENFRHYFNRYLASNILQNPEANPIVPAYSYTTKSSVQLKPTLDKLEAQMYLHIIVGEKPVDYFDEFVKQWKTLGGDTLTKEVQEMVDKK